ncbi:MAG: hypothetical protein ACK2U9_25710, partial [Anaerolineae bacterium]
MPTLLTGLSAAALLLALSGCGDSPNQGEPQPAAGELVKSDKQRITAPAVPSGDLDSLTKGN